MKTHNNQIEKGESEPIAAQSPHSIMSSDSVPILADRIRSLLGPEGTTDFARRCGIGESLMRKYLKGAVPSATNLVQIADAAGVSVEWLAAGRGPRSRIPQPTEEKEKPLPQKKGDDARRIAALVTLLDQLPEPDRARLLDEFLSRATDVQQLDDLRRAIAQLRTA